MFTFFRRIRKGLLGSGATSKYLVYAVGEIALVVIGILIAFQVDRYYESLKEHKLQNRYLERLQRDLKTDTAEFAENIERTEIRLKQIRLLEDAIYDPESVVNHANDFVIALEQISWKSFPAITAYTYSELLTSGRMIIIQSEDLRNKLSEYYTLIEEGKRLGLDENDQDIYRDETVGILSAKHLSAIEDTIRYKLSVSELEAVAIAREFASRAKAHPWLARIAKYQVLMRVRAIEFRNRSNVLITEISKELANNHYENHKDD